MSITPVKKILFYCLAVGIGFTATLTVLEAVLRFFPVRQAMTSLPVNADHPIFRFAPNTDFLWSRDWNFSTKVMKHSNNYGFLNDQNYVQESAHPLLAVIGDSYVEAAHVKNEQAHHGLLSRAVAGEGRVYSFGSSGSALAQYLAYAGFAKKEFHPSSMAFVVVGNDFDESLLKYKRQPGHHYFKETSNNSKFPVPATRAPFKTKGGSRPETIFRNSLADGPDGLVLTRIDHRYNFFKEMLKSSALVRYVYFNCGFRMSAITRVFMTVENDTLKYVGNTSSEAEPERLVDSKRAVTAFLDQLPERAGLSARDILLVVDGMRPHLYSEEGLANARGSYFDRMRRYFMHEARTLGYEVVDMQPRFRSAYQKEGVRFEFPTDGHWNALGHQQVADEIVLSSVFKRTFRQR